MLEGYGAGDMMIAAQGRPAATALAFISAPTFNGATFTIPNDGSVIEGDLALLLTGAMASAGVSTPPAEVLIPDWPVSRNISITTNQPQGVRGHLDAKILAADEIGDTLTGIDGAGADDKVLLLFRPNGVLSSVAVEAYDVTANAGDPAALSIALGGDTRLRLIIGHCFGTSTGVTASGTLVTNGVSAPGVTTRHRNYYEIITGAPPATRTLDMGDSGANVQQIVSLIFT